MSLEQAINDLNTTMKAVHAALVSGGTLAATLPDAADAAKTEAGKKKPTAKELEAARKRQAEVPVFGDPEGTTYWHIEKHKTVAAVVPGGTPPNIEGAVQIDAVKFVELRDKYRPNGADASGTSAQTAQVQTAASGAQDAQTGATTGASSQSEPSFKDVHAKLVQLSNDERPGKGRAAVIKLIASFLPEGTKPTVPALEPLKKNAEILAAVEAALADEPADDDLGLGL